MTNVLQLVEELKLRMNSATQTSQDQINAKMMQILEVLATQSAANLEQEVAALRARLLEAEEKLKRFAAFDGDGDGRPGGSKKRAPMQPIEDKRDPQ